MLITISPDSPNKLAQFAKKEGIKYHMLSDPDLEVAEVWGLVNESNPEVPHPTAVIVDSAGVIQYFRQDVDYKQRPMAEELLAALRALD